MEYACGGIAACSTCHVVVDTEHFDLLAPADDAEVVTHRVHPHDTPTIVAKDQNVSRLELTISRYISHHQLDMVDLAHGACYTSRLGCQLVLTSVRCSQL